MIATVSTGNMILFWLFFGLTQFGILVAITLFERWLKGKPNGDGG